jgi:hypothetical protein
MAGIMGGLLLLWNQTRGMLKCSRIPLGSLLIFCWFSTGLSAAKIESVDDILALRGNEFYKTVWSVRFGDLGKNLTQDDRFKIIDRMIRDKAPEQDERNVQFSMFVEDMCERVVTRRELSSLAARLEGVSTNNYLRSLWVGAFLDAELRLTLADLEKDSQKKVVLPPWNGPMDARLSG